jgi:hypothetical protein
MMGVMRKISILLSGVGKHGGTGSSNQAYRLNHSKSRYSWRLFRPTHIHIRRCLNGLMVLANLNGFRKCSMSRIQSTHVITPPLRKVWLFQLSRYALLDLHGHFFQ